MQSITLLPIRGQGIVYLTRSISARYALHGALLVFLASELRRYLPVVRFLAVAGAIFGAMMLGIDFAVRMPLPWAVAEPSSSDARVVESVV